MVTMLTLLSNFDDDYNCKINYSYHYTAGFLTLKDIVASDYSSQAIVSSEVVNTGTLVNRGRLHHIHPGPPPVR